MRKSYLIAGLLCLFIFAGIIFWEKIIPAPPTVCVPPPTQPTPPPTSKLPEDERPPVIIRGDNDDHGNDSPSGGRSTPENPVRPQDYVIVPDGEIIQGPDIKPPVTDPKISPDDTRFIPPNPGDGTGGDGHGRGGIKIYELIQVDRNPEPVYQAQPQYPFAAKQDGRSGSVMVEFIVGMNGKTSNIRIIRATDPVFNEATVSAVEKWRFNPAMKDGVPVVVRVRIPMQFNIEDAE